ncbi:MipA/OmpV family protein [Sulfitobacter sp. TSTF-M16]|uniref:MipA/OmpV family protein n=1 Tax=Sulfitobacter aestuariivivens TaxID=2766981 RepID=A0A927D6V2_9RHOB|nr:MipA/OmpV family protein [Sulfitobacter aestuariivivens]MBD3664302.1 MipA/OmpV family protein [Sulfitobacter aestuariivivens]
MRIPTLVVLSAAMLAGGVQTADAQDRVFNFALRGGIAAAPEYPGSSNYRASPDLGFTFGALQWGPINSGNGVRGETVTGLGFRGAFNVIGDRDSADNPELAGLKDIDAAVELGFGVIYREVNWQVFGEVRHGFGGHHGVTGTLGGDLIFRPDDRLTITAGPRLNIGNTEYAQTYFGITAAEAAASSFGAYNAEGGLLGAGFEVEATYELDDRWALEGAVRYEMLQNAAADSPITQAGSEDQWTVRLGLSRVFNLRF